MTFSGVGWRCQDLWNWREPGEDEYHDDHWWWLCSRFTLQVRTITWMIFLMARWRYRSYCCPIYGHNSSLSHHLVKTLSISQCGIVKLSECVVIGDWKWLGGNTMLGYYGNLREGRSADNRCCQPHPQAGIHLNSDQFWLQFKELSMLVLVCYDALFLRYYWCFKKKWNLYNVVWTLSSKTSQGRKLPWNYTFYVCGVSHPHQQFSTLGTVLMRAVTYHRCRRVA